MKNIKKLIFTIIAALILVGSSTPYIPKVLAATGQGTATIDGSAPGGNATIVQATSHKFTVILTVGASGITTDADSPTFTIPNDFTAPTNPVSSAGDVLADGDWFAVGGATCPVTMGSSSTLGQVITVDVTTVCTVGPGGTITLTYQGQSSTAMGATALAIRTAVDLGSGAATPISNPPTITVTAASPTSTPTPNPTSTPTPTSTSTPTSESSSSSSSTGGDSSCIAPVITTIPIILESKRVSPTSISITWGPYAGIDTFNVQYGLINGNWPYNTNVTGFSTTINSLPFNQPIWIQVAARNNCSIGTYGTPMLVGGPNLPDTGFAPHNNILWYIILDSIFLLSFFLLRLKRI